MLPKNRTTSFAIDRDCRPSHCLSAARIRKHIAPPRHVTASHRRSPAPTLSGAQKSLLPPSEQDVAEAQRRRLLRRRAGGDVRASRPPRPRSSTVTSSSPIGVLTAVRFDRRATKILRRPLAFQDWRLRRRRQVLSVTSNRVSLIEFSAKLLVRMTSAPQTFGGARTSTSAKRSTWSPGFLY